MNGYRQSSYDPNAYDRPGPVLKPYNAVQWAGLAMMAIGAGLILAEWAGRLGWIPRWIDDLGFAPVSVMIVGSILINTRRAPGTPIDEEQRAKNKRTLVITLAICAVVLGAAALIEFQGA